MSQNPCDQVVKSVQSENKMIAEVPQEEAISTSRCGGSTMSGGKPKSILWNVCIFILFTEMCERLAFYGFSGTLVEFLLSLGNTSTFATQMVSLFSALVYVSPLLGGFVADQLINRYNTILLFISFYLFGLFLAVLAAIPNLPNVNPTVLILVAILIFIALGAGGIKANVVTFGADQFDTDIPEQKKEQTSYFNYFYWVINIGALLAYGYIANLSFDPATFSGGVIPDNMGYFASYLIPLACLLLATIGYVAGTRRYKIYEPTESAFSSFARVFYKVCSNSLRGRLVLTALSMFILAIFITIVSYFIPDVNAATVLAYVAMVMIFVAAISVMILCRHVKWTEEYLQTIPVETENDTCSINNTKDILLVLPYFCILVIFWVAYIQMSTNFQLQGCQMNMNVGGVVFSPAFFNVFDCLAIIVAIPLVDNFLYPYIERKLGRPVRVLDKMAIGLILTAAAMLTAGFLEIARLNAPTLAETHGFLEGVASCCAGCVWHPDGGGKCSLASHCGNTTLMRIVNGVNTTAMAYETCEYNSYCKSSSLKPMKDISIFWQILPYALVGLGEIFTSIPAYDMFYNEVGPEIRSVAQAVNLLSTSMGSFAGGGFQTMFQNWLPENLNLPNAHVDYIFFVVAGLCIVAFGALKALAQGYVYREDRDYHQSKDLKDVESGKQQPQRTLSSYLAVEKT